MFPAAEMVILHADYFVLIMFRVSGLVISSPIFGRVNVPAMAKIGLALSLGFMFFLRFPQVENIYYTTLMGFVLLCAAELLLGMALAYVTNIFFSMTAFVAGQMIDMQIGFGIVNVFDAQNQTQVPMMGNVLNIMLLILFFMVNGHLRLIEILHITIDAMPIGSLVISGAIGLAALEIFIRAFLLGLMMALPILASGLTLEVGFGMLMRAVPQIHMFVVGMPLKIIVGLTVFSVALPFFANFSERIFSEMFNSIELMFGAFTEDVAALN